MTEKKLISFETTSQAIGAEKIFKEYPIEHKLIPTPRYISVNCGFSIIFSDDDTKKVEELLNEGKISGVINEYR